MLPGPYSERARRHLPQPEQPLPGALHFLTECPCRYLRAALVDPFSLKAVHYAALGAIVALPGDCYGFRRRLPDHLPRLGTGARHMVLVAWRLLSPVIQA